MYVVFGFMCVVVEGTIHVFGAEVDISITSSIALLIF